jgi:hypothetical protein
LTTDVPVTLTAQLGFPGAVDAIGGNPRLVVDGAVSSPEVDGTGDFFGRHSRTAVGVTGDGRLLLVVVDGRQPGYSRGMTLRELAELLRRLGAVQAMNLDGGGSSEMVVNGLTANRPSDGRVRGIANALVVLPGADTAQPPAVVPVAPLGGSLDGPSASDPGQHRRPGRRPAGRRRPAADRAATHRRELPRRAGLSRAGPSRTRRPLADQRAAGLRVQPAGAVRLGHAADADHLGGGPQRHLPVAGQLADLVVRRRHEPLEPVVDLVLGPEVRLQVLHPLEVRHGDAARVGQHVGDHAHAVALEHRVGVGGRRAVGALDDEARPDPVGVALVDDALEGGRDEHVDVELEQLGVGDRVGAG